MLKHVKVFVAKSLDSSEKKKDVKIELDSYSKSASELVYHHLETTKMMTTTSNFLQLPGEKSRRQSTVSFSFLEEEKTISLEGLPALSRGNSIFSRFSDLLSPSHNPIRHQSFSRRPSVFSRLSDLANQSTRPSSLYSSLSEQSKIMPKIGKLYGKLQLFVILIILLIIIVTILVTYFC
jgi:hypothetical protein